MQSANLRRAEITILAIACVLPTLTTYAYFVAAAELSSGTQQAIFGTVKVVQFALPIVWIWLVCREWPLWRGPSRWGVTCGLAFGLVVSAVIVGLGWFVLPQLAAFPSLASAARDKVIDLGVDTPARFLALGVFYALAHSLLEEYYWRWFVFGRIRNHAGPVLAGIVSSLAFAAHHVVLLNQYCGEAWWLTLLGSLGVAIGGGFWAWLYHQSRDLWGAWLSHLAIDAALFAVGYRIVFSA